MKNPIVLLVFTFFLIGNLALNAQDMFEKKLNLSNFDQLHIQNGVGVKVYNSKTFKVVIQSNYEECLEEIESRVANQTLYLKRNSNPKNSPKNQQIKVLIYLPEITSIKLFNGCAIKLEDEFSLQNFAIEIQNGSSFKSSNLKVKNNFTLQVGNGSSVNSEINTQTSDILVENGSSCTLDGFIQNLNIEVENGSSANLQKLEISQGNVEVQSASAISLPVEGNLEIKKDKGSSVSRR